MNPADRSRFEKLISWGRQHGATLHDQVEVYNDELTKYSLRLKPSAPAIAPSDHGCTIVKCPASITLSYLNALTGGPLPANLAPDIELEPSFPSSFMTSLPPHVIGRFFLIQQYLCGAQSFWYPYIRTLPQPEHLSSWALPAFWPEEDIEFLTETNADVAICEVQANVKGEFKRARRVLKEAGYPGWQDYSRLLYNWAFCMFTSRSFRPTTVLSEQVRCGLRVSVLPETCKDDDFSLLMPVMDIANHDLRAKVTWDTVSDPEEVKFVSRDVYEPGQQIFNNYGMKTNSELLLGYGFILPESETLHNDYIHLRKRGQGGADTDQDSGDVKPKDFLISLRPMMDPSSVVGRSRQVLKDEDVKVLPALAHIEDSLVMDLIIAQATHDEEVRETWKSLLSQHPRGNDCLRRILASPTEPEVKLLVEGIEAALTPKLAEDYGKILYSEVDEDEQPILIPSNQNQKLGASYRRQCKSVLHTTIEALGGYIPTKGASEEITQRFGV